MRATLGFFAIVQGAVVALVALISWLLVGPTVAKALCLGGGCAWLGSIGYLLLQPRQASRQPWGALRAHLFGQLAKWIVAASTLLFVMRQAPPETAGLLVVGFALALLVHALAVPLIKSR